MAIAQMDLISAGHAYHVCTAMPLCPNVLLVTEALGEQESEGSNTFTTRACDPQPTAFTENPLGPKSSGIKVTGEHVCTHARNWLAKAIFSFYSLNKR